VHDENYRARTDRTDRQPALLLIESRISLGNRVRIVEDQARRFKPQPVLAQVELAFALVPLKYHERY